MKVTVKHLEVEVPTQPTKLIDLCYKHDLPINFGCRIGMCGTCIVNITNKQNVSSLNSIELEFGLTDSQRMACQCIIMGDVNIE